MSEYTTNRAVLAALGEAVGLPIVEWCEAHGPTPAVLSSVAGSDTMGSRAEVAAAWLDQPGAFSGSMHSVQDAFTWSDAPEPMAWFMCEAYAEMRSVVDDPGPFDFGKWLEPRIQRFRDGVVECELAGV